MIWFKEYCQTLLNARLCLIQETGVGKDVDKLIGSSSLVSIFSDMRLK